MKLLHYRKPDAEGVWQRRFEIGHFLTAYVIKGKRKTAARI
jgi:hypothetical protein